MSRVTVDDDRGSPHVLSTLGPRPAGDVHQAVVVLQTVDELTGLLVGPVSVSTALDRLTGRSTGQGVAGLTGVPRRVFPDLATHAYPLDLVVEADGYLAWIGRPTVAAQPGFPQTFVPLDLGTVALHRRPVAVDVVTFSLDPQDRPRPLPGTAVHVTAIWRRTELLAQAGQPARMLSLPVGSAQPWPAGTGLDGVSLVPAVEPVRRLTRGASPGDTGAGVDRAGQLTAGDLVGLDLADGERREYLPVSGLTGAVDVRSPTELDLTLPVRRPHADGTQASRVPTPPPAAPDATLTEPADVGDVTVFVNTTGPFGAVEVLRARDTAITDEYVDALTYQAVSDADGHARLPGLSRVAAVQITATNGALSAVARVTPTYPAPATALALILR
jgi:hypothetical protein